MKAQQCRGSSEEDDRTAVLQTQQIFYNTYLDDVQRQLSPGSLGLSQKPTTSYSSGIADSEDAAPSGYSTPLSSAPSEEVMDLAMSLVKSWPSDKLTGCTAARGPLEATPDTFQEIQGPLHGSFSAVLSVTEERGVTDTTGSMDTDVPFQDISTEQVSDVTKAGITSDLTSNGVELIGRVPMRDSQDEESHDKPLPLDQEGTEFEVESLVAKGRIGRRVWYKVKWKGYPESDNSGGEFKFERLVSKQEVEGVTRYEAKWQGQPSSENMWVDKWDVGAKVVARFEAGLIA